MTAISPGDEVTVTITGTVTSLMGETGFEMVYPDGRTYRAWYLHPDVKVTVLRPDRPTRREVWERHQILGIEGAQVWCYCRKSFHATRPLYSLQSHANHLLEELTKWEEN